MAASRTRPVAVAVIGLVVVTVYAAWAALQILVLNPLAAAPGRSLAQIHAEMDAAGQAVGIPPTLGVLAIGPLLAAAVLVGVSRGHLAARTTAMLTLALLALGAFGYFWASFMWGMNLADTYGIGGGDHSPWARPLYAVSLASLVGLIAVAVADVVRDRRAPASVV